VQDGERGPGHCGDLPETVVRVGAAQVEGQKRVRHLFETRRTPGRRKARRDASGPAVRRRRPERVIRTRTSSTLLGRLHCPVNCRLYPLGYSVKLTCRKSKNQRIKKKSKNVFTYLFVFCSYFSFFRSKNLGDTVTLLAPTCFIILNKVCES